VKISHACQCQRRVATCIEMTAINQMLQLRKVNT
jgi:hypothetical protein